MTTPAERARAYLARMGPAIEGQGGDVKTFKAAAVCVADFGLDDVEALAVLREWNAACVPPWEDGDLVAKIRNARRNAKHKAGSKLEDARGRPVERPLPPATYPELEDVRRVWASCVRLTDEAAAPVRAWLASRGIDPEALASPVRGELVRALPLEASGLPSWASRWAAAGYSAILPLYDARGEMRSFKARRIVAGGDGPKAIAPRGFDVRGLVLADDEGAGMLASSVHARESYLPPGGVLIVEGEPDFLGATMRYGWPRERLAVFGVHAGAWTPEHAAAVPRDALVTIATHGDEAGGRYAHAIASTLPGRDVRRYHGRLLPSTKAST